MVEKRYRKSQTVYERNVVIAVGSVYGIDIIEDNVAACRQRLYDIVNAHYTRLYKKKASDKFRRVMRYILKRNIIHGDALDLKTVGEPRAPIVFSQWSAPFHNSLIKRIDYTFSDLLPPAPAKRAQPDLFSQPEEVSDIGTKPFLPSETASYPSIHYLKIGEQDV